MVESLSFADLGDLSLKIFFLFKFLWPCTVFFSREKNRSMSGKLKDIPLQIFNFCSICSHCHISSKNNFNIETLFNS